MFGRQRELLLAVRKPKIGEMTGQRWVAEQQNVKDCAALDEAFHSVGINETLHSYYN